MNPKNVVAEEKSVHMAPEEFRRHGHAVVDWIADYQSRIESLPVLSQVKPGQIRASLPAEPPAKGEEFEAVLKDVDRLILPGVTHWQSPNFFAYFPCNASGPGILGDLLSSGLGVQGMLWSTSPACTELETHVMDWLVGMLGLPEKFLSTSAGGGVIQDTASSAVLCALLAARERGHGLHQQQERLRWKTGGVCVDPDALVTGESRDDCRNWDGEPTLDRSGREVRNEAGGAGQASRSRSAGRADADFCVRDRGHNFFECDGPCRRDRRDLQGK